MANILVVDDDAGTREWASECLSRAGHRVLTAQDGLEAQSIARTHPIELVITDISMPNEEGFGLILDLRKSHPQIQIVVVSGKDPEVLLDAQLLGAQAALRKPVTRQQLLQCIAELSPPEPAQSEAKSAR
jgi:two-component system, chemotaxis family, chemotaxis protein CheY